MSRRTAQRLTALLLICAAAAWPSAASAQGRSVPTEQIIVPPEERVMPDIPVDDPDDLAQPPTPPPPVDLPQVLYDPELLPPPVRRLREQIMEAASSGDPESLRIIIDANPEPPAFSFGHVDDPIAYLKSLSGDPGGREIMAILLEVLEAGFVHADPGTPDEAYVWPYFARYPVDALTPQQLVELFKLVYAGDYDDMLAYGYYLSYRLAIAPDGTWRYFIAGD